MFKLKKALSLVLAMGIIASMGVTAFAASSNQKAAGKYGTLSSTISLYQTQTSVTQNPDNAYLTNRAALVNSAGTTLKSYDFSVYGGVNSLEIYTAKPANTYAAYGTHGVTGQESYAIYSYTRS